MSFVPYILNPGFGPRRLGGLFLVGLGLATGCQREDIAVYDAPKDAREQPAVPPGHGAAGAGSFADQMPPRPGLTWKKLPQGWTSREASGMRVAHFTVAGPNNGQAELAVIPLPGTGGGELDLVNLWRGQVSLEPITEDQLKSHTEEATIAGQTIKVFSIVGSEAADAKAGPNQIVVVALRREGFTWFFKLAGDAPTVNANRESLKEFLGGLAFSAPTAAAPPMAAAGPMAGPPGGGASPAGQPKAAWQVPPDWKGVPAPQMVHSKWSIEAASGRADITVSVFPGDTGGLVPNLNRWRAQVGLKPAAEGELGPLQDNTEVLGGKATVADFTGTHPESGEPLRLLGAVVRRDGYSWFYKLLGPPATVEAQREVFVKFLQSVTYTRGS